MAEIVERLRDLDKKTANPPFWTTGICGEAADEIEQLRAEIERLRGSLSNLVEAVDVLIAESEGVYGLHLNGDPSLWEELTEVGWLLALEEARAVLDGEKEARATTAMKGE